MRILCSFAGGAGHLLPQLPILTAARDAGHRVDVCGRAPAVQVLPPGLADEVRVRNVVRADAGGTIAPIAETTREHERAVIGRHFAGGVARRSAEEVGALLADRPADVVLCDEVDFGARLAAERAGVPCAVVGVIASGAIVQCEIVAGPLAALRSELGLDADPDAARITGELWLSPFPPAFRDPAFPLPEGALSIGPASMSGSAPAPVADDSDRPLVYATLGTEFNIESGDLFSRILAALGRLPIRAVLTVGGDLDPAGFDAPANVRVERFLDTSALLAGCAAVLSHGGSGTVMSAIAHALPQLVVPMGADQPFTADRVEALGIGRRADAVRSTPGDLADALAVVLADDGLRARARGLRDAWAREPGPGAAVRALEHLASGPGARR
ncbi:glycosyltransferase [Pseudolysinimonas kribbensis]|uniref:glycosyltransferase n=1 Tax=Pseudolysinimonas kribbensis TaxID=433641 RepID=UPI0031D25F4A